MRILITGGAGFIGSHTAEALLGQGHAVTVFDDFSTGKRENLGGPRPRLSVVEGDVRDFTELMAAMRGCDAVLHLAAVVSVPLSITRPHFAHEVNATGSLNVLEAARYLDVRRVVMASSAAVYGVPTRLPLAEDTPPQVLSPYAAHKWMGEAYARTYAELHGMHPVCLRYFNVFGPRQDPASPYSGVLSRFIGAVLEGKPATIHGDGSQTRDFVYVSDVAQANMRALFATQTRPGDVFNVGTGRSVSVKEAFEAIARAAGSPMRPAFGPARAGDVPHSRADVRLAEARLGFRARMSFQDGLGATIQWARMRAPASLPLSA